MNLQAEFFMKILLDECVTKRLKKFLTGYEVFTTTEMGWSGLKNGKLLAQCVANGFDVLLTIDKNLLHQQNLSNFVVIIVVFDTKTSKIEELKLFIPAFNKQIPRFVKSNAYLIEL